MYDANDRFLGDTTSRWRGHEGLKMGRLQQFDEASGNDRYRRDLALRHGIREGRQSIPAAVILRMQAGCRLWVTGGCRRQVDGTAGLPSAPEMPCAPGSLRLVP